MSNKAAMKTKGKAGYAEGYNLGKKPTYQKGFNDNVISLGGNYSKSSEQSKFIKSHHKASTSQPSGPGIGPAFGLKAGLAVTAPQIPERHETDLAEQWVADVLDSSPDVNALCQTYKLKREELGRLTGFSLRALAEWASGKLPSQPAKRRLQEVRRLLDALSEIVKQESIPACCTSEIKPSIT